jgi:transposase
MVRHRVSGEQWVRIAHLLPGKPGDPGRSGNDKTGTPWRELPPFFGKWNSVWKRFSPLGQGGDLATLLPPEAYDPDFESMILDGTIRHGGCMTSPRRFWRADVPSKQHYRRYRCFEMPSLSPGEWA